MIKNTNKAATTKLHNNKPKLTTDSNREQRVGRIEVRGKCERERGKGRGERRVLRRSGQ